MGIEIKIETTFIPFFLKKDDLPEGIELITYPVIQRRDLDFIAVATGVLKFASEVSASIIGAWIYDKIKDFKNNPEFLFKINEKILRQIDENSITELIQREIEISKK